MSPATGTSRAVRAPSENAPPAPARFPRLRPCALLLLFLAATLTLWGFGCKLSHYNPHPDVTTRAMSAKLWDKHQQLDDTAGSLNVTGPAGLHAGLALALATLRPARAVPSTFEERASLPVLVYRSAIPLRSPPSPPSAA